MLSCQTKKKEKKNRVYFKKETSPFKTHTLMHTRTHSLTRTHTHKLTHSLSRTHTTHTHTHTHLQQHPCKVLEGEARVVLVVDARDVAPAYN